MHRGSVSGQSNSVTLLKRSLMKRWSFYHIQSNLAGINDLVGTLCVVFFIEPHSWSCELLQGLEVQLEQRRRDWTRSLEQLDQYTDSLERELLKMASNMRRSRTEILHLSVKWVDWVGSRDVFKMERIFINSLLKLWFLFSLFTSHIYCSVNFLSRSPFQ